MTMKIIALVGAAALLPAAGAMAQSSGTQPAGGSSVEFTGAFVCPVITTDNVLNSVKGMPLGDTGDYTISGPTLQNGVPVGATNGDGAGVPAGQHSSPGDPDYTAIWARC